MRRAEKETRILGFLALALAAIHVFLAARWVAVDRQPPNWDPSVHLGTAFDYKEALQNHRWLDLLLTKTRPGHQQYPPAYHYSLIPLLSFPNPQENVVWLNLLYLTLMTGAAAWMARRLGGAWPAAATMIAVSLSPRVLHTYREVFVDIALAAWVVTAYALILRSDFYASRKWSLAVGAAAGLATLSKFDAPIYLLPGICAGLGDARRRANLLRAVAVAALLSAPWYLVNMVDMVPRLWTAFTLGHKQGNPLTWTWDNWTYYLNFLARCFSWPALAIIACGIALAATKMLGRRDENAPGRRLLAAWVAFAYVFCTLTPSKDYRYFLHAMPATAALGFSALPAPALAASSAIALANLRDIRRPDPGDWHLADVLSEIRARKAPGPATLCLLMNHRNFNSITIEWTARYAGDHDLYLACEQTEIPEWADFVLLKTDDMGAFLSDRTLAIAAQAQSGRGLFAKVFRETRRWELPDRSSLVLYEQRKDFPALVRERKLASFAIKTATLQDLVIAPRGPGRYEIRARALVLDKLPAPIRDLRVALSGARIAEDHGRYYILHVNGVELLSARLSWADLSAALSQRSRLALAFGAADGRLTAELKAPVRARLALGVSTDGGNLAVLLDEARVAGIKIPFLSGRTWTRSLAPRAPYQPYSLKIAKIQFQKDGLNIGS